MKNGIKYFFTCGVGTRHPKTNELMDGYWIEVILYGLKSDEQAYICWSSSLMRMIPETYKAFQIPYDKNSFKKIKHLFTDGCYEKIKIYLPLPEEIKIEDQEPFLV